MQPERWRVIPNIFHAALEHESTGRPASDELRRDRGQANFDDQSAFGGIGCVDGSAMHGDGAFGNGEAQAGALGVIIRDAAEGQEYFGQHAGRDAGPVIADAKKRMRYVVVQ